MVTAALLIGRTSTMNELCSYSQPLTVASHIVASVAVI